MVLTNIGRHVPLFKYSVPVLWPVWWLLTKTPYQGCQTVMYCAVSEELQHVSGHYYGNCAEEAWSKVSLDDASATKLWTVSEALTGVRLPTS